MPPPEALPLGKSGPRVGPLVESSLLHLQCIPEPVTHLGLGSACSRCGLSSPRALECPPAS